MFLKRKQLAVIWTIVAILGILSMIAFTVLPVLTF